MGTSGKATMTLIGRLTRDAELRTAGDAHVLVFSLATSHREKRDGQWVDAPDYWDVESWSRPDTLAAWMLKGRLVYVTGEAKTEKYQAKDGTQKTRVKVRASDVWLLPDGAAREPRPIESEEATAAFAQPRQPAFHTDAEVFSDDIPF